MGDAEYKKGLEFQNGCKFEFWTDLVNGTVYRCNKRKCKATTVVKGIIIIIECPEENSRIPTC